MIIFLFFTAALVLYAIADLKPDFKSGNVRVIVLYAALAAGAVVMIICSIRNVHLPFSTELVKSIFAKYLPSLG